MSELPPKTSEQVLGEEFVAALLEGMLAKSERPVAIDPELMIAGLMVTLALVMIYSREAGYSHEQVIRFLRDGDHGTRARRTKTVNRWVWALMCALSGSGTVYWITWILGIA